MWHLTACKISFSHSFLNWTRNEMIFFYRRSELMLPTLIQRYNKNHFNFDPVQKRETNWNFTGCKMPHLMIILLSHINLLNLTSKKQCLFLRNMEPLNRTRTGFLRCIGYRSSMNSHIKHANSTWCTTSELSKSLTSCLSAIKNLKLTLDLLNPDTPCLWKQCRSRSVGRSQLIWICTVCH